MEGNIKKDNCNNNYNNQRIPKRQTAVPALPSSIQPTQQQQQQQRRQQQFSNNINQIYPEDENFQQNGNKNNNINNNNNNNALVFSNDNQKQSKEIHLWCKALKITSDQFFTMPDEELKLRINNLKGRLRLKVAKNLIAYQKEKIEELINNQNIRREIPNDSPVAATATPPPTQISRFRNGSSNNEPLMIDRSNRIRDSGNIWDILYRAAADVEADDLDIDGDCDFCDDLNTNYYDSQFHNGDGENGPLDEQNNNFHTDTLNYDSNPLRLREPLITTNPTQSTAVRGYVEFNSPNQNFTDYSSDEILEEQLTQQSNYDETEEGPICDAASGLYISREQSFQRVQPQSSLRVEPRHSYTEVGFDSISEEQGVPEKPSCHTERHPRSMNKSQQNSNANSYHNTSNVRSAPPRQELERCPSCQKNFIRKTENKRITNGTQNNGTQCVTMPTNNRNSNISCLTNSPETKDKNHRNHSNQSYFNSNDKNLNSQSYPQPVRNQSSNRQVNRNQNIQTLYSANNRNASNYTENGTTNNRNYPQHQNQCSTNDNFDQYDQ